MSLTETFKETIKQKISKPILKVTPLSGGCSYPSYLIDTGADFFFVKTSTQNTPVFEYESNGLNELRKYFQNIPAEIHHDQNMLVLEYIANSPNNAQFWTSLGKQLAEMHQKSEEFFGHYEDNFIGAASQKNKTDESTQKDWANFFWKYRIEFKLHQISEKSTALIDQETQLKLKEKCLSKLSHRKIHPAPLHGDLWSGNIYSGPNHTPYLIDPAFYYGDPETDIAMTECFGGFAPEFYDSYWKSYTKDEGYEERKHIYNLYHMLNHALIFSGQYNNTSKAIIKNILES